MPDEARYYVIEDRKHPEELPRLIEASTAWRAIIHTVMGRITARLAKPKDVKELYDKGVRVETAKPYTTAELMSGARDEPPRA